MKNVPSEIYNDISTINNNKLLSNLIASVAMFKYLQEIFYSPDDRKYT